MLLDSSSICREYFDPLYVSYLLDNHRNGAQDYSENIWNLQHQFNVREGETWEEYTFPPRFYEEVLPAGSSTKSRLDKDQVEQSVKRYFSLREWDF